MEHTKHIIIVLIFTLLTTGTAVSQESEMSDTLTASCLMKIISDPSILPLEDMTIDYLLHSSGVAGKASRETLEEQLSDEALGEALQIEWLADEVDMMQPGFLGDSPQDEEGMSEYDYQMMMMQEMGRGMSEFAPFQPGPSPCPSK